MGVPVRDALDSAVVAISASGSPTARLDAELLLAHALGITRSALFMDPDRAVSGDAIRNYQELVRRRSAGREPVAYLVGHKGFRHIELEVDPRVLVPRPETELLVEVASGLPNGARVLDVGTGSGAVALALAHERPDLRITGSDVSAGALEVAAANRERLGLDIELVQADLLEGLGEDWDAVLANPPYVAEGEAATLQPDVRLHEPAAALFAGEDGLDVIRRLVPQVAATAAWFLAIEVGAGQAPGVRALVSGGGFDDAQVHDDLAGIGRVVAGLAGAPMTPGAVTLPQAEAFAECIGAGGVALFPADTVYGLACDPENAQAIDALYGLKGRSSGKSSAVMFFTLGPALDVLPDLGPRTRTALESLLPGAVTLLLENPGGRFPLACGSDPSTLGLRVPALGPSTSALEQVARPVLQSSANLAGGADVCRLADVPATLRDAVDLVLDGGELPGTASTVIDLRALEKTGRWSVVRAGAVAAGEIERRLG